MTTTAPAPPLLWRVLPAGGYAGRARMLLERSATASQRSCLPALGHPAVLLALLAVATVLATRLFARRLAR